MTLLANLRIVLVRPIRPGNIGAVCRAMTNMGLSDLVLVAPQCDPRAPEAEGFAARAKPLLHSAAILADIPSALADCVMSFAASGKGGVYRRQAAVHPRAAAEAALSAAGQGRVAIAFGPEDQGLVLEELLHFDRVIEIPAHPDYPVMNLAAAATVICYELHQAARALAPSTDPQRPGEGEPLATDDGKRILLEHLFRGLDRIGFFRGQQSENHLQFALRRVIGKVPLTRNECDVLLGMAKQINWYADQFGDHPAAKTAPPGARPASS